MKRLPFYLIGALGALACLAPSASHADLIKQSSTYSRTVLMTDSADHIAGKTGLTLTVTASKNGGAFASITPTITELGAGRYKIALTTSHTDTLGPLDLNISATGADPSDTHDQIVAFDPSDAASLGLSRLDAAVSTRSTYAGADTAGTTTLLSRVPATLPTFPTNFSLFSVDGTGRVTTANPATTGGGGSSITAADVWAYTIGGSAASSFLPAIKAKTDLLTFDGAGYVLSRVKAQDQGIIDALAAATLSQVVDGSITLRQAQALQMSVASGKYVAGAMNASAHTKSITFYRQDGATVLAVGVATYNTANTEIVSRAVTFQNLP